MLVRVLVCKEGSNAWGFGNFASEPLLHCVPDPVPREVLNALGSLSFAVDFALHSAHLLSWGSGMLSAAFASARTTGSGPCLLADVLSVIFSSCVSCLLHTASLPRVELWASCDTTLDLTSTRVVSTTSLLFFLHLNSSTLNNLM